MHDVRGAAVLPGEIDDHRNGLVLGRAGAGAE
jgi:hypothetical protein